MKSRARYNQILYNRLTDESGGQASYELELPDAGIALVMGNLIEQQPGTQNATIVSYGAEGHPWSDNLLAFAHNTLVNRREAGGTYLRVHPGPSRARVTNNLFVGGGEVVGVEASRAAGNLRAGLSGLRDTGNYDYRLAAGSPRRWRAVAAEAFGPWDATSLVPTAEYVHPMTLRTFAAIGGRRLPGAIQG